jgi:hypothetical protein
MDGMYGGTRETGSFDGSAASVVAGLATFAGAVVELPAVRTASLVDVEQRGRVAAVLADGWNLAAFTPSGALVLDVLDAAGARIELLGGGSGASGGEVRSGVASHGNASAPAAWGAPPGRRIAAMGLVPGPGGGVIRASCGLVLRLPATALVAPDETAVVLAWHAAMHAAERRAMPAPPRLSDALDLVEVRLGLPRAPRGRVAWATGVALRVVDELGGDADTLLRGWRRRV